MAKTKSTIRPPRDRTRRALFYLDRAGRLAYSAWPHAWRALYVADDPRQRNNPSLRADRRTMEALQSLRLYARLLLDHTEATIRRFDDQWLRRQLAGLGK